MTEREIFTAALEIDDPQLRRKFIESTCAGNDTLRHNVEGLFRSLNDAGSFLEHGPLEHLSGPPTTDAAANAPDRLDFLAPSDHPGVLGTLDQYEVLSVCGQGGMGIVLKAHDPRLKRIVALKVLAPEFAANPTARKRFLREAQAAAAVTHPHVVTIYAVEEGRCTLPYLVMEYIAGQTLRDKIEREGTLSVEAILRIGSQIACGLAAAHKQGLIHRDIKPANVLLENGIERVKLTDFGLARAVDDVSVTRTGEVAGTPQYMSPEQAQGQLIDHRSDLFSLGSVLYTMCTGRPPFRGETVVSVIRRVCDESPRPIREINPEIPDWLADVINRLLAKDPAHRIQTAPEVADLFDSHLAQLRSASNLSRLPRIASPTIPSVSAAVRSSPRVRWLTAAALFAAFAVTLGATEVTGVTNFAGTLVRIVRGDGTLVIAVDDPNVSVSLDGEDLVITGAGLKEIRVPAGPHQLTFSKDGRSIDRQLVTVTRGGRQIVSATLQPSSSAAEAPPAPTAAANPPTSTDPSLDLDALVAKLHARYPEAQLGLMYANRRLTITGRPFNQSQADAILDELTTDLLRRYPLLGRNSASGDAVLDPDHITLSNDLQPPPITEQLARLGRSLAIGAQPDWSPDGKRMVYARPDGSALEIIDVAAGASNTLVTTTGPLADSVLADPAWSPDGDQIAFVRRPQRADVAAGDVYSEEIWLMPAAGGPATKVGPGGYPNWLDGPGIRRLSFVSRDRQGQHLVLRSDWPVPFATDGPTVPSLYAAASPNARWVATDLQGTLQIRHFDTGAIEQTWRLPVAANGMILNWSPDSRYLSIAPYGQDFLGLWIYDTTSRQGQRIIQGPVKGAVWSRDGSHMALETAGGEPRILVLNLDLPANGDPIAGLNAALTGPHPALPSSAANDGIPAHSSPQEINTREQEQDAALVIRTLTGKLSPVERTRMLAEQHPIFGQLADPHTKRILEFYAKLTADEQEQLHSVGYLKWKYADLTPDRKQVYLDALEPTIRQAEIDKSPVKDMLSLAALERAEVGFANVDISEKGARLTSWFILLPEYPSPIWVTVVNAKYAGTTEYFAAHNAQLNALRLEPLTSSATPDAESTSTNKATDSKPDDPLADSERLVVLAQQALDRVQALHDRGAAGSSELRAAKLELIEARITVARQKRQRDEVASLFDESIAEFQAALDDQHKLREAGVATAADVGKAEQKMIRQRQLKQMALDSLN